MRKIKIIPAIDIIDGKSVRLTQGDYGLKIVYSKEPLDVAKKFEDFGIRFLHLVDLDGAKNKKITNWKVLEKISTYTNLHIDFGGGMNKNDDLRIAFECGAKQVNIGSVVVNNPDKFLKWLDFYGKQKIILSADSRKQKIAINAWQDESDMDVIDFILKYEKKGIQNVVCTDIEKDGNLKGPAFNLYKDILKQSNNINLIASGGVSSMYDVDELMTMDLYGIIIGKSIYEGKISLKELSALC